MTKNRQTETKQDPGNLFTLGSKKPHEFLAVCLAAEKLFIPNPGNRIECFDGASGVNLQPVGYEETLRGAQNLADFASVWRPGQIAIGIQNGIFQERGLCTLTGIIVVNGSTDPLIVETERIRLPDDLFEEMAAEGFNSLTVGQFLARRYPGRCDPEDPHQFLTNGKNPLVAILSWSLHKAIETIILRSESISRYRPVIPQA